MGNRSSKTTRQQNETQQSQVDLRPADLFETSRNDTDFAESHSAPLKYEKKAEGVQRRSLPPSTGCDHQGIFRDPEHQDILSDHKNIFPPDQKLSEEY